MAGACRLPYFRRTIPGLVRLRLPSVVAVLWSAGGGLRGVRRMRPGGRFRRISGWGL